MSALNVSLDFPAVLLATAPQLFHSNTLEDGILSGKISLSETLEHPRIVGEVQLVNGKLGSGDSFFNFIGASTLAVFDGKHASVEFLNLATKDVDLALGGEIDFENTKHVVVKIAAATPIFDLMSRPVDCVNKIEIAPVALPLAPAATELEFSGPLRQSGWSVSLKEDISSQFSVVSTPESAERIFPLCFGTGPEEKTLLLGAVPRGEVAPKVSPKKTEQGQ
jgi:autotransporter translocation and assembly factor TamB